MDLVMSNAGPTALQSRASGSPLDGLELCAEIEGILTLLDIESRFLGSRLSVVQPLK
jgi:hypothetical protein